jgi:tetratricopeptide (TPR) repeat protein
MGGIGIGIFSAFGLAQPLPSQAQIASSTSLPTSPTQIKIQSTLGDNLGDNLPIQNLNLATVQTFYPEPIPSSPILAFSLNEQLAIPLNNGTRSEFRDQADWLMHQGTEREQTGAYGQALGFWQEALQIYQRLGDAEATGLALDLIGLTYGNLGLYPEAEDALRRRLAIARTRQDFRGQIFGLNNLGTVLLQSGYLDTARGLFEEAYGIGVDLNYAEGTGLSLSNLGLVAAGEANYPLAIGLYEEAWLQRRKGENLMGEANTLNNLGDAYQALQAYSEAIEVYSRAEFLARESRDMATQFRALTGLGDAFLAAGHRAPSLEIVRERWQLALDQGNLRQEFSAVQFLARFYQDQGDRVAARNFYQRAIVLGQQLQEGQIVAQLQAELSWLEAGLTLPEVDIPATGPETQLDTGIRILEPSETR